MLYCLHDKIKIEWEKDTYWGHEIRIQSQTITIHDVITCFVKVFMYYRFNDLIRQIIRKRYFYTEHEEIERICILTRLVISERYYQTYLFKGFPSVQDYIYSILDEMMEESFPVHFDSLVTFSLQPLSECLIEAVGYGIDEMKREEEHQNFIQSIRDFIMQRKPKIRILHIIQGKDFSFYKENGQRYRIHELKVLMQNEPLYIFGLDDNEMHLSPVITLLPEKIYIYGDHPSEAKTLTLINIFQERVSLLPRKKFPFFIHMK